MRRILILILLGLAVLSSMQSLYSQINQQKRSRSIKPGTSLLHPVKLIDSVGLHRLIRERNGKVLLLNIWATWCLPCKEEFPGLIKLAGKDTLIEVVGISVDYPDEINSKVIPFLLKLKVPFQVYVAAFTKQENFITAVDSLWNGAIPATYLYDRQGTQRVSMIGEKNYEEFMKEVNSIEEEKTQQ
jgi:thiol-disulfide isomerase/thioredoxin